MNQRGCVSNPSQTKLIERQTPGAFSAVLRTWFLLLLALSLGFPGLIQAQTVLNYPRVISSSQLFTGIAVSNPTPQEVSVTFTAIQPDGTNLAGQGIQNPVTVVIPAGGQYARLAAEIFNAPSFNGWVQATSQQSGVVGFFLNGTPSVNDLDGAEASQGSAELTLPVAAEDDTIRTEVTLVNTNSEPSAVTVTLYASDGTVISTKNLTMGGHGLVRQTLSVLFSGSSLQNASHVQIKADRPILAHEVVANFQVPGTTAMARETIAISGRRPSSSRTYAFPQFVTGGGWLSFISLVNAGGVGQDVTLTAYQDNGQVWNVPGNPKRVNLEPNAGFRSTVQDLFGFPATDLKTGWIEAKSSLGFLVGTIGFGNTLTPSFAAVSATDTSTASTFKVYSQVAEGGGFFTGMTLVNTNATPAAVELYILKPDGTTVGRAPFTLAPNERSGRLFRELLPASLEQVGGWAFVRSDKPLIGAVLFGDTNGLALANVPDQIPLGNFLPPAQKTAAITGSVSGATTGAGVSGVTVTITGPVTATKNTDDAGQYIFSQLPAGDYKVTVSRPGVQFQPAEKAVSQKLENTDGVNFLAFGLDPSQIPLVTFVTPSATSAGNGAFNITVLGQDFTPASYVELKGVQLATTFVNTAQLKAAVPAGLVANTGDLDLVVVTPPPGGGRSKAFVLAVNPVPSDPLIDGRAAVGSFPAGVAVHPGRKIALITSESDDTVRIVDLKTLKTTAEVKVGRSPADGIAIDTAHDLAFVANTGDNNISVIDLTKNAVVKTISVGNFPTSIAVDSDRNRAYVVNGDDDTVSVIDIAGLAVTGSFHVTGRPYGIAIHPRTNQAVVTSRNLNTVSVIDLGNGFNVLGTVPVGSYPRSVAINAQTNVAVVVNANGNSVTVINLLLRTATSTITVGKGPTGVAIYTASNIAAVTNSGVVGGQLTLGALTSVSMVSLDTREVIKDIPVGSAAFGVDVDPDNQRVIVANFGANEITAVKVPNPRPRIDDIQPKTFPAGGGSFTVIITGSGFVPTSVVTLNGVTLPTTFISSTELRAVVPAGLIQSLLQARSTQSTAEGKIAPASDAASGTFNFNVSSPGPGGGDSPPPDNPNANKVTVQNAVPVLVSISPTEIEPNKTLNLSVSGNNFNGTSTVNFAGKSYPPATSSDTTLSVVIPAGDVKSGTYGVSVTNPAPGGGTTQSIAFNVLTNPNPNPVISTVLPSTTPAGGTSLGVQISGSGFINATTVTVNNIAVSASISDNSLTITIPGSLLDSPGTLSGHVQNPKPGGGDASFSINLTNPIPSVTTFSPKTVTAGAKSLQIQVNGSGFAKNAFITFAGTQIPTNGSGTQLTGDVADGFIARAGDVKVGVTNPAPGGGAADAGTFTITSPVPSLSSVSPSKSKVQKGELRIQLTGKGFIGNSRASARGTSLDTFLDSDTSLTVVIPGSMANKGGVLDITVTNPPPGGGTSGGVSFTLENPVPVLTSVSPTTVRQDQKNVTLTVNGTDFVEGATILFGPAELTATFSETQLTAPLPALLSLGNVPVTVKNPAPGGGPSNALTVQVNSLLPVITGVTATAGPGQTITVTGTNFARDSSILLNGNPITTSATSDTQLTGTIPANTPLGSATVQVRNPGNGGGDSNSFTITISVGRPSITSLSTSRVLVTALATTPITINGSGFVSQSEVRLNGNSVGSQFGDESTITFTVPGGTGTGTVAVTVTNPSGGGTSNSASLSIENPAPAVSSVNPNFGPLGQSTPITVSGSGFVPSSTIQLDGAAVSTTYVNGNTLTGTIQPRTIGSRSITVSNPAPGGGVSQSVAFDVRQAPTATVEITPNVQPFIIKVGRSSQFTAVAKDSLGNVLTGKTTTWSSSLSAVASVDGSGNVQAVSIGNAIITATIDNISATVNVRVVPEIVRLEINPATVTLTDVGQHATFTATAYDFDGLVVTGHPVTWISSDPSVATIDVTGVATAVRDGSVTITGTEEGVAGVATLVVQTWPVQPYPIDVTVTSSVAVGSYRATITFDPAKVGVDPIYVTGGNVPAFSGVPTTIDVSQPGVLVLAAARNGTAPTGTFKVASILFSPVAAGSSNLNITVNSLADTQAVEIPRPPATVTLSANAVTVAQNPVVASVQVLPSPATLTSVGATQLFTAKAKDAQGRTILGKIFTWASSNTAVATVNASTGLVTAVRAGTATITATTDGIPGSSTLSVQQAVSSITLNTSTLTFNALGQTSQLTATAFDANSNVISGTVFVWSSSTTNASVTQTGLVTAVSAGSATITATAGGRTASASVSIQQITNSVTVTPATDTFTALGVTHQFTANALDVNSNNIPNRVFVWSSSNPSVASVNSATGAVTSVASGTATITATADGRSGTAAVTVTQVVTQVVLSPSSTTLQQYGATQQFVATARDSNNTIVVGPIFTWTSSNPAVATVTTSGLVTAVDNGTTTISAATNNVTGSAGVTVDTPTAPASVAVMVTSAVPVGSYQVTIDFDPTKVAISPTNVTGGTGAGFTVTPTNINTTTSGRLILNSFQVGNSPTGTFSVANIVFTPVAVGTSSLILTVNALTDAAANDLPRPPAQVLLSSGSVFVRRVSPVGSIVVISSPNQSATVASQVPFEVEVRNLSNAVMSGVPVLFSVTSGGGSVSPSTVVSDSNGRAVTMLTMGQIAGLNRVVASASGVNSSPFDITGIAGNASQVVLTAASNSLPAGGPGVTLTATIKDGFGNTVPAGSFGITYSILAGTGSVVPQSTTTSGGIATALFTSGVSGAVTIQASSAPLTPGSINLIVTAGAPANMTLVSGNNQSGQAGIALTLPLRVKVLDGAANGVAGVTVNFSAVTGGGSVNPVSAVTDANGEAQTTATAGGVLGTQIFRAASNGLPNVDFSATIAVGTIARLQLATDRTSMVAGTQANLTITAQDQFGNTTPVVPNPGILSANPNSSVSFGNSIPTPVNGIATTTFSATLRGTYIVSVLGTGNVTGSNVSIDVTPDVAVSLAKISGDNQTGPVGTALASPLVVEARDQFTNAVSGVAVTFTVTSGNGSVNPASAQNTGANGRVQVSATLGSNTGTHLFTASASGMPSVVFAATGSLVPANVVISGGNNQVVAPGISLLLPLKVHVTNSASIPVPGVNVAWAVQSGGGSVSAPSSITDSNGDAVIGATVGSTAGTNTISATVTALPAVTFTAVARVLTISPSGITVNISSGTAAIGSYQVTITYNKDLVILNASNVTGGNGAGFTTTPTTVNIDNNVGLVTINSFQTGNSPSGNFTVAGVTFTPIRAGTFTLGTAPQGFPTSVTDTTSADTNPNFLSLSNTTITVN